MYYVKLKLKKEYLLILRQEKLFIRISLKKLMRE